MLPDYEIERTKTRLQKALPIIEFMLMLIIIQSILTFFTTSPVEGETIQFRLLAHSNAAVDQHVKKDIQREIEPLIETAVAMSRSKSELGDNLVQLESRILTIAKAKANGRTVSLERKEALFPPKRFGLFIQPQATYDAYVLTIGSGRGDNWWCALFPKICFPDEKGEDEDEKVTFFIWEWIKSKIF